MNAIIKGQEYEIRYDHDGMSVTAIRKIILVTGSPANEVRREIKEPSQRLYNDILDRCQNHLDKVNEEMMYDLREEE